MSALLPSRTRLAAALAVLVLACAACGGDAEPEAAAPPAQLQVPAPSASEPVTPADVAEPVAIRIPAIEVDAEIVPVGLNPDGSMEVPDFGLAAYYTEGPKPGAAGPAVVVAHVDSRSGPDVFARLTDLAPGDEITIARADGTTGTWSVESQEQVDKDQLPTDRIWNTTDQPVLRLVTCGGDFDDTVRHYEDNIIVYASPVV